MNRVPEKTLHDLEWQRIAAAVAARCVGPRARRAELPLATTFEGVRVGLGETSEATALLAADEPLPLDGVREVRTHLLRLERHGALDGPALNDIRSTLGAARVLRRFLGQRKDRAPLLLRACALDPTLDRLEDEIGGAVDADGTVADSASSDLRKLRAEVAHVRGRVTRRLEELVVRHAALLSDRFFTIREGRYVLPVRRDAHERFPGIVHGTSASGATVFVEPRALVAAGNRLKMAQAEMEREEARILGLVSDLVRERLAEVGAAADAIDHADLRSACARFGRDLGARVVELLDVPRAHLHAARHPILLLDAVAVVPNDLELESGHALVVSGPNAGGKTVALKMLGLAALMVQAGVPVPCAEGSACGFFGAVLTDVGDDQSISKNLSTFSAHVTNLARILDEATDDALVLLDELAGGTDPQEGAALACAVVDALCRKGAALAVTTHYEPLKALGARDERLRNASVGFDVTRMAPTFELRLDVPGASSALAVASRFGIPEEVIATARRVLPEQARTFDELVRRLEDQRRSLEIARAGLDEEREQARRAREAAEAELEALRRRDQEQLGREAKRLVDAVRRAREDVRRVRQALRRGADEEAAREARAVIDEAARTAGEAEVAARPATSSGAERPRVDAADLAVGDRVWVARLRTEAEVIAAPDRGRVRVAAGPMKLWVEVEGLRRAEAALEARAAPAASAALPARPAAAPVRSMDNTLDVRGMRVEEAIAMTESFLDRLYGAAEPVAYVVHGVGTGALRDAIRERLRQGSTYVRELRPGTAEEGGDRLTVVYLA